MKNRIGQAFIIALLLCIALPVTAAAMTPPGVVVVGQIAEPKSLDPAVDTAVNDFRILMNVYDGLTRYRDGSLEVGAVAGRILDGQ